MKHIKLHAHYPRKLVQEKVVSLLYYRIDDQVTDIFTKPLFKAKFVKVHDLLGIQVAEIMGVCTYVIPSPESLEHCANGGGVLEPLIMLVMLEPLVMCDI